MLLAFVLSVSFAAIFVSHLGITNFDIEREKRSILALNEAKVALVGYMLKRQPPDERVGDLPCPDKSSDKNYDGTQDSPCASSRVGKFPWRNVDDKDNFVDGISLDLLDGYNERLWFVVSRNLVDPTNVPLINNSIVSAPKYPWLSVYNDKGVLLTNRAAALIISPGKALQTQNRAGSLPAVAQFLDSVVVNGVSYTNSSATGTKFISGNLYDQSGTLLLNDRVAFLTIDEVMPLIEKVTKRQE